MQLVTARQWKLWRLAGDGTATWAGDTDIGPAGANDYRASNYSSAGSVLAADGYPVLALRFFGASDADDLTEVTIAGWMHDTSAANQAVGPGQRLWSGRISNGARTFAPAASEATILEIPLANITWREADEVIADEDIEVSGGSLHATADPGGAFFYGGDGDYLQRMLILPTLGYTRLTVQLDHAGSPGTHNIYFAVLARGLTACQLQGLRHEQGWAINPAGVNPTTSENIVAGNTATFS